MTEKRYDIPLDALESTARVPVSAQVEAQSEPRQPESDWSTGLNPYGDGMSGDADGD